MPLLQRLYKFLAQPAADPAVAALYGAAIAQARRNEFYSAMSVPDTLDGRFDMLLLHVFMLMHRLAEAPAKKQALFDLMFADMDRSLREMGVGDMSIGKKIRPMISAFYGRTQAYEKAVAESPAALAATLGRNLYGKTEVSNDTLARMADYVQHAMADLTRQPSDDILAGRVQFIAPDFK